MGSNGVLKNKILPAVKKFLVNFFTKNIAIKIVSLIFAMILWGYVLMDQNPDRTKLINDVTVSFDGEGDLIQRKLVVRGDKDEILKNISVSMITKLTEYADLDAADINATVSLNRVSAAGTYELPISVAVNAADSSLNFTTPDTITVEIDDLVTRSIPVETELTGELEEGYWAGTPALGSSNIIIEGAAEDVARIVRAVCTIDLTKKTASYNQSMRVKLLDEAGAEVSSSLLLGQLATVTVKQEIYKTATVPINVQAAVIGTDNLPANYEIAGISITPSATATVAGNAAALEALSGIDMDEIDVTGASESVMQEVTLNVPEGIRLLSDSTVTVYVNIREVQSTLDLKGVTIEVTGAGKRPVTLDAQSVDISISGRITVMNDIGRSDITAYIDLNGMASGTYDAQILVDMPNRVKDELTCTLSADTVRVTVGDR